MEIIVHLAQGLQDWTLARNNSIAGSSLPGNMIHLCGLSEKSCLTLSIERSSWLRGRFEALLLENVALF